MRNQRWVYVMLIVVGILLGLAIAGLPSGHQDQPLHATVSTTTPIRP